MPSLKLINSIYRTRQSLFVQNKKRAAQPMEHRSVYLGQYSLFSLSKRVQTHRSITQHHAVIKDRTKKDYNAPNASQFSLSFSVHQE